MSRLVAVTGATGFVGPHLLAALARHGWKLRVLMRRWSPIPSLVGVDAEVVWGDLGDEVALRQLVGGADAVLHAAGLIKAKRAADFHAINRDGTVLLTALAPDVPFLLLSSLAAREPQLSPYAASKRAAEEALARRGGAWVAVRAPAVYGPGDRETLAYFRGVARGVALEPKVPGARLSLIHVSDLAEALALALEKSLAPAIYEVDDGHLGGHTYQDMAKAAAAVLGRRARTMRISRSPITAIARWNALRQRAVGSAQILTPAKVNEMFHPDWTVHDRQFAEATDFRPRYDLEDGFRDTILWYRARKWL